MILGSCAAMIWPKVLLLKFVVGLVFRKLFVTLKASTRNSTRFVSLSKKILESAASNCQDSGPRILAAPIFESVPVAGSANAAGLRYLLIDPSPYTLERT